MEAYILGLAVPLTLACIAIIIYGIAISIKEHVAREIKKEMQKNQPKAAYNCGFVQEKEKK